MSIKAVVKPGVKGYGPLGNMIIATLLDLALKGKNEAITISSLAAACDVPTQAMLTKLRDLQVIGVVRADSLFGFGLGDEESEVGSIALRMPTINVEVLQHALPEVSDSAPKADAKHFGDRLDLLIERDSIMLECGWADGTPFWWRVGCVADQESDCVVLSAMRELWDSESEPAEPAFTDEQGQIWVPLVEARKFGPNQFGEAGAREEAVAWLREMLEGFDPSDEQREFHGLGPAPVTHPLGDIDPLPDESLEIPENLDDETEVEAKPMKGRKKKAS